jgi:hypothetical protein
MAEVLTTARRILMDVKRPVLLWLAPGVTAVIAVVSAVLVGSIDAIFEHAVSDGRVFPYTGAADEQGFNPGLVLVWSALATLVTLVMVALIGGQGRRGQGSTSIGAASPRRPAAVRSAPWLVRPHLVPSPLACRARGPEIDDLRACERCASNSR